MFFGFVFSFFWTRSQAAALPNEAVKNVLIAGEEFFPYQITVLIFVPKSVEFQVQHLVKLLLSCEALSVL